MKRRYVLAAVIVIALAALVAAGVYLMRRQEIRREEARLTAKPEAPPDLAKHRQAFIAGLEAIQKNEGDEAIRQLGSFRFGSRAVEEYRLYYLANGHQLKGDRAAAREVLSALWRRDPQLVFAADAGFNLAALNERADAWSEGAEVYRTVALRADTPAVAAAARWQEFQSRIAAGDVAGARDAARLIVIRSPRSAQAQEAIMALRALDGLAENAPLRLSPAERLDRAVSLLRDRDQANAIAELDALSPSAPESLRLPIQLNRGLALFQLRRFEEANKTLEPLTSGYYKYAIPALYHLSKSYRLLSNSIDPTVTKTITQKKRVGTIKVRVGKGKKSHFVRKPKIVTVKKTIKLVDLAKKAKKEEFDRLSTERLKDLLQLPLADEVRIEVLNTLIAVAEAKNQDEYEQQLVSKLVALDPLSDPGLQHFWDKAWGAYMRGDLQSAKALFVFISSTYSNPNVKRQADYWFARTVERQGQKEEAAAVYRRLAAAPYDDIYAIHASSRGAPHDENRSNPLSSTKSDWSDIAEREMPRELRLAYELTALTDLRDARIEIQKNVKRSNQHFADALLADIYHSTDNPVLMYRSLKRAFPQLATVEQDSAPKYFLRMYYPMKYQGPIRKFAQRNAIDPNLVMGLILQESYYDVSARSAVGATGLMQIMPSTGKELASRLRLPFGQARLEDPEVNIQLGTSHLKMLLNMFGGNQYLAVASYNAGQGNVLKWRRANSGKPIDEFLESIPFPETRNYVKRVTMLQASYKRLSS